MSSPKVWRVLVAATNHRRREPPSPVARKHGPTPIFAILTSKTLIWGETKTIRRLYAEKNRLSSGMVSLHTLEGGGGVNSGERRSLAVLVKWWQASRGVRVDMVKAAVRRNPKGVQVQTRRSWGAPARRERHEMFGPFKQWLKKFDADNDGRISKEELLSAIYETGGQFAWCKSRRAIKSADADGSGFIEENEDNT
ncbi:hypothetical protein Gotur_018325 [Gossypium turneri]